MKNTIPIAQTIKITEAKIKYMSDPLKLLSEPVIGGRAAKVIALRMFKVIPLSPLPNITAPIYLNGNMPANPNTLPYTIPPIAPKTTRIEIQAANPASGLRKLAESGRPIIRTEITKNPPEILST